MMIYDVDDIIMLYMIRLLSLSSLLRDITRGIACEISGRDHAPADKRHNKRRAVVSRAQFETTMLDETLDGTYHVVT